MAPTNSSLNLKKRVIARHASSRRQAQRDQIWPDAADVIFQRGEGGWAQMPRTVPMIATLLDELGGKNKPGRLYITLWSYDYGDGFVPVHDPVLIAAEAGYVTTRAERTFVERMRQLRGLGFIRSSPLSTREFGFVLLLNPHQVIVDMRAQTPKRIPELWWSAFTARCSSIGVSLPRPQDDDGSQGAV